MTKEELIKAINDNEERWSCPEYSCDKPEEEGNTGECCLKCAEKQLAEYEKQFRDKIIADTMDLFLDALKTYDTYGYEGNYLLKLSKENEKDYVPYIHLEDVIECANGTVKMLKGE